MKLLPLNLGYFAQVDDEDYDRLIKFKWYVQIQKSNIYVIRVEHKKPKSLTFYLHRQILGSCTNSLKVDHIDNNGLNNKKENLRICSEYDNGLNKKSRNGSLSEYVGVTWYSGKWHSGITINGIHYHMGSFFTEIEAAISRDKFIIENGYEFPVLNILTRQLKTIYNEIN